MSVHVEFMSARDTIAEVLTPGTDWVGAEDHQPGRYVLALSVSEVTAIEGTLPELCDLADRISTVVARAARAAQRTPRPTQPGDTAA